MLFNFFENIFGGRRFREPLTLPSLVGSPHAEERDGLFDKRN